MRLVPGSRSVSSSKYPGAFRALGGQDDSSPNTNAPLIALEIDHSNSQVSLSEDYPSIGPEYLIIFTAHDLKNRGKGSVGMICQGLLSQIPPLSLPSLSVLSRIVFRWHSHKRRSFNSHILRCLKLKNNALSCFEKKY